MGNPASTISDLGVRMTLARPQGVRAALAALGATALVAWAAAFDAILRADHRALAASGSSAQADQVAAGQAVYGQVCAVCHGEQGEGGEGGADPGPALLGPGS